MIELQPICIPKFDYRLFIKAANFLLGKEINRPLDAKGTNVDTYPGLNELLDQAILGASNHLHFSFIIKAPSDVILESVQLGDMRFSWIGENGALVTGNLKQWFAAIDSYCSPKVSSDVRYIYNQAAWYFEQLGFSFSKKPLEDGTWQLVR